MKIIEDQNKLIWRDNRSSRRVFGLLFSLLGLIFPLLGLNVYNKSAGTNMLPVIVLFGMGFVFVMLGFVVVYFSKNTEVSIEKPLGKVTYRNGKTERVFKASEIDKIELINGTDDDGEILFTPWLKLKNGEYLSIYGSSSHLPDTFSSSVSRFNNCLQKI
jgi:hypothetical protein